MDLRELQEQIAKLPKLPPRTTVVIVSDTKGGRVYAPVRDLRFDGAQVVIEDGGLRW